jgi:hypothetical protein
MTFTEALPGLIVLGCVVLLVWAMHKAVKANMRAKAAMEKEKRR